MAKNYKETLRFPDNFLWGVSTSAYQTEGGIVCDWSGWEKSLERIKGIKKQGLDPEDFICDKACDSYHRYKEDLDLVKDLNCGVYRMGVEWARIEPQPEVFSEKEIEHYRQVLKEAKKRNLKVVLTLWHWTNPVWVQEMGGWANKKVVEYFLVYAKRISQELGDLVDFWVVLNEPMVHVFNGYIIGKFPPNKFCPFQAYKTFRNLVQAQRKVYDLGLKSPVGITALINYFEPAREWCFLERSLASLMHYFWNHKFLKKIKNHIDFIGVDYYFHDRIVWYPPFRKNLNEKVTDMGWEIYPEGIYYVLKYLGKFKKPIYIMENGIADAQDKYRADFIKDHLYYAHKAIEEGVDVRGYFYWSLLDNFEWAAGWDPKFGLYKVNRKTFQRKARPSAKIYSKICQSNSVEI